MEPQHPPQFIGRPAFLIGCAIWGAFIYATGDPIIRFFEWLF